MAEAGFDVFTADATPAGRRTDATDVVTVADGKTSVGEVQVMVPAAVGPAVAATRPA